MQGGQAANLDSELINIVDPEASLAQEHERVHKHARRHALT